MPFIIKRSYINPAKAWFVFLLMKQLNALEYLKLNKFQRFLYDFKQFFCAIPGWFKGLILAFLGLVKDFAIKIKDGFLDIIHTFVKGNWAVKLSFVIFGLGNIYYGQIARGILFFLFEVAFVVYMFFIPTSVDVSSGLPNYRTQSGLNWLKSVNWFETGNTVGTIQQKPGYDYEYDVPITIPGEDSTRVLFNALLAVIFIIAFIVTWRMQVKQCRICMDITASGKKIKSGKDDLKSLLDDQFHKTLLAPSIIGIGLFTVLPMIFMIIIAFTNYSDVFGSIGLLNGQSELYQWVGFKNLAELLNFSECGIGVAFGELLVWTLIWAVFATFTNYFLGMMVAIMINKKGIKIKKFWRTVLVMTIAIPQFVSLLYISKMFDFNGFIGSFLYNNVPFIRDYLVANNTNTLWQVPEAARIMLIVINIWVGIPYVMLMATGILMNIPADLYESAQIDGANGVQQFTKITLPYMLFVTGPYLLTSFVGNLNNFNIIFLLSGGGPTNFDMNIPSLEGLVPGHTDLLITWLFKLSTGSGAGARYYLASALGILIFLVVAILSLIVYNVIPSTKNEEDFA